MRLEGEYGEARRNQTFSNLADQLSGRSRYYKISEVAFRKDAKAEITEIRPYRRDSWS